MKDASGNQARPKRRVKEAGSVGPPGEGGEMRAAWWWMLRLAPARWAKSVVERTLQASSVRLWPRENYIYGDAGVGRLDPRSSHRFWPDSLS